MNNTQLFILIACALVLVANVITWLALRKIARQMRADFERRKTQIVQSFNVEAAAGIEKIRMPFQRNPS